MMYPSCDTACGPAQPWRPPGIPAPWPHNEYLCDGGDQGLDVDVLPDWTVRGLDQEDTVAHYDTLDGQTRVQPSNRVCLYAPRFAAVRQVSGLLTHEVHDRVAGMELPVGPQLHQERGIVTTVIQPVQPERYLESDGPLLFQEDVRGADVVADQGPLGMAGRLRAYEDLQLIRDGVFENTQKARLSISLDAALAWTEQQAVQVVIDNTTTVVATNDTGPQSVYRYEMPPGKPRVRVVKLASTAHAQPGELVEFTIRFDNIGDQPVGNVTIVDNLTTRLEYVPDTQECSREADFFTQENAGESLVLRWEIKAPLEVSEGGVIRFTCRVR
jgi:uncharacterized repeat protein (TIGR01451 family)